MSDKRGNADMEDVLSSVLRLMSEDLRVPGRVPAEASHARLVLTPDQRIAAPAQRAGAGSDQLPATPAATLPGMTEEALRDLIRDILRDELQGPLGERITRSVRKLVLTEVHRVIATRDGS